MAPEPQKPDIERITNRYIDAWETFGKERFSVDDLENELLRQRDPEDVPDANKINQDLYRVTQLGLVTWYGEGNYQVAISPESDSDDWKSVVEDHIEWIQSEIHSRLEEREEDENEEDQASSEDPDIIEYNGEQYLSAFVGRDSDIDGQARYYQAALKPSTHDGVVLRAYQDVADSAEKLAEKITDDDKIKETVCVYRFSIHDTQMAETDDDLEYRVYLDETKLL
jgi:hypothetical protein